ncbi:MAG: methylmalonyl-CoA decarboxylase subunit alpha [Acidimicrobiaceae bacterium]|nr:methylmalonyl-CoA decarboxylase subunit alpha [Acidimicrobiaceae bacterium]
MTDGSSGMTPTSRVGSFTAAQSTDIDPEEILRERRAAVVTASGPIARARIETLVDAGTFVEVGTFTHAADGQAGSTGDARVGGTATIDGRTVVVAADNAAVLAGTSAQVGNERLERLMNLALTKGVPFVYLADGGQLRPTEAAGAEGLSELGSFTAFCTRERRVPMATAILGDSADASAFLATTGDFTVLVRGAAFTLTPGADPPDPERNGLVDDVVDTVEGALAAVRCFLSFLPSSAWATPPRADERPGTHELDHGLADMVPRRRTRAYDMRKVLTRLVDPAPGEPDDAPGELFELRPASGRGLVTALARIDGWPVAIFASNPMYQAGALDPAACEKGIRLLTLCDAYQVPAIFLQDVVGFLVGRQVEHGRLLFRAVRFLNALYASSCPTLTVLVRKAFGLAYETLNGRKYHTGGLYAWAGAEIGFMDPEIGVNVLYGDRKTDDEKRAMVTELREGTSPFDAAGVMNIDEVIDPAATRQILARDLATLAGRQVPPVADRVLRLWPTC